MLTMMNKSLAYVTLSAFSPLTKNSVIRKDGPTSTLYRCLTAEQTLNLPSYKESLKSLKEWCWIIVASMSTSSLGVVRFHRGAGKLSYLCCKVVNGIDSTV